MRCGGVWRGYSFPVAYSHRQSTTTKLHSILAPFAPFGFGRRGGGGCESIRGPEVRTEFGAGNAKNELVFDGLFSFYASKSVKMLPHGLVDQTMGVTDT
nr:MAG TPA: hypothetical protein [Caudoviricetes sp.]